MKIEINGDPKDLQNPTSLEQLIQELLTDTKGMAVAINNQVIPKTEWAETDLKDLDKVLLITATQGG